MSAAVREILQNPSKEAKLPLYKALATSPVTSKSISGILEFVDHLLQREADQYGRTYITPEALSHLIKTLADEDEQLSDPMEVEDELTPLMQKIVEKIRQRADDFPDALLISLDL